MLESIWTIQWTAWTTRAVAIRNLVQGVVSSPDTTYLGWLLACVYTPPTFREVFSSLFSGHLAQGVADFMSMCTWHYARAELEVWVWQTFFVWKVFYLQLLPWLWCLPWIVILVSVVLDASLAQNRRVKENRSEKQKANIRQMILILNNTTRKLNKSVFELSPAPVSSKAPAWLRFATLDTCLQMLDTTTGGVSGIFLDFSLLPGVFFAFATGSSYCMLYAIFNFSMEVSKLIPLFGSSNIFLDALWRGYERQGEMLEEQLKPDDYTSVFWPLLTRCDFSPLVGAIVYNFNQLLTLVISARTGLTPTKRKLFPRE